MTNTDMCPDCTEKYFAWLDYKLPPVTKIASGAARDDTAEGIKDRKASRLQEWKDTINRQQKMIRDNCNH